MKTFTRIFILGLVILMSSAVVFAQNNAKKTTISDVELQMMQQAQPVSNHGVGAPTDLLAVPISSFPYIQNFEAGWPAEMDDLSGANADAYVESTYAYSGDALFMEGNTSTGWGSTPSSYSAAFDASKSSHFGTVSMDIVPDGSGGVLTLEYMMRQGYSFNSNYSWYRVLVNGAVIYEMGGGYYWQPSTLSDPYLPYEFDLSSFAGAPFTLQLQSSCKYYKDYYNIGDWTGIDDLKIWYKQDPGDLEGYVMNGGGLAISGASVGIDGWGVVTSDPTGYYFMSTVPGGNNTVWGWKDGYNIVTYDNVPVPPLGLGYQDIILTAPTMFISPTFHEYTLNPEEYFTTQTGITNTGDGPLAWSATVVYPVTDGLSTAVEIPAFTGQIQQSAAPSLREAPKSSNAPAGELYVIDGVLAGGIGYIGEPATDNLYLMDFDAGYATTLIGGSAVDPASGDMLNGDFDNMYVASSWGASLSVVDVNTGASTLIGNFSGGPSDVSGMACDRTSGTMYVSMTDVSSSWIGVLDVATGAITDVFSTPGIPGLIDIAIDGAGQMYGWGIVNDASYLIDKATGAVTNLGPLGYDLNYGQGGNYNINDGIIYMTAYANGAAGLYVLDPVSGAMAPVGGVPSSQCTALGIPGSGGGGAGDWLTLDYYSGVNPGFGTIENVPTNFDASGTSAGEVYTADIVFTSDPDVGTSTIPCTMIIAGDPLVPPTNLVVTLVDDINGVVNISWDWTTDAFQFFVVKRDGAPIGTSTTTSYTDNLPDYGTYCYTVQAYYDEGYTAPAGPECVEWPLPEIFIDPDFHEAWVWVDATYQWTTTVNNLGIGSLQYVFPNYVTDVFDCQHEVILYDDFGDGWNGGTLTVYVDGTVVLNEITLGGGAGPESYYFIADGGQEITSTFTCGSWCYECSYEVIDGLGNIIATDGTGGVNPTGIPAGTCYADCPVPSFIVDVSPATGIVPEGGSEDILITWDATGFPPGDYYEDLLCESNDPVTPEVNVGNLMHVYTPAQYAGTVTDCESGIGIPGVTVTASTWQTITDNNGDYTLYVDEGTYAVYFDKLGYESFVVADTSCLAGVITPIDVTLCEAPYPVPWVTATVNYPDEDYCTVDWGFPIGPYEILYDDGSAEDLFVWSTAYNENAVRFTPSGYPAEVIGGRVYVGDGLWPAGSWLSSEFAMLVYDDDGTDGAPGTVLDSIPVVVTNYGWLEFFSLAPATLDDGEFYLSMMQLTNSPDAAPVGIDLESPTAYRSWSKMSSTGWSLSVYQDFMIRAYVDGPQTDMITDEGSMVFPPKVDLEEASKHFATANNSGFVTMPGTVKSGAIQNVEGYENATDDVTYYVVARMSDFDPDLGPATGTMTILNNVTALTYQDDAFQSLPMGWYAYAVKTVYSSGYESVWVYSNVVGRDMDVAITFEVTLCDGNDPEDVEITLNGKDFPEAVFFGVTDATGIYTFDQVWKGEYEIEVFKIGYEAYYDNQTFLSDQTIEVMLSEKKYPPRNLWVDPLTSYAYWEPPLVVALEEDFEGVFPPVGWQMTTNSVGWFQTADGSSGSWTIPSWNSLYACSNDDQAGSVADGSVDYLITPALDLREVDTYHMMFDSYYDGAFGQLATVEYSYDAGATWEVLYALTPMAGSWDYIDIDLASFSGLTAPEETWFAFHSNDGGQWASGWAIDNVVVANGETDPDGYHVYLDGAFVDATDTTFYQYEYLTFGVTYTASVAAVYSCGLSDQIYYTWTSGYLAPPRNLDGFGQDDAAYLWWEPPLIPDATYDVLSEDVRTSFPNANSEYSPMVRTISVTSHGSNRDLWDVQANFACGDASGEAGVETDGNYVYTTKWNAGSGTFFEYEMDGTFNGSFTVSGGAMDVRDLAYNDDDGLFYGSNAGTTVWGMNFAAGTVDNTISAPIACRAIAYDNDAMGFWANNWSDAITLFDMSGATVTSFPVGTWISYYGFAYDYWTTAGTPYLWGFSQGGAGADLVQMDINAGGTELFNMDVYPIVGGTPGTDIAGGLYTHCAAYVPGKVTLGGILQNFTIFAFELADCSAGPGPTQWVVPENLLGYNLYRDMNNIAYIPYNEEDTSSYWDFDLLPLCYDYDVTALYDLTPYGFPGDTGESAYEGPKEICVEYGWPLPFVEEWNTGSFDPNLWTNGENWVVNGQVGNPEPSSEFKWDPILTDYRSSLTSYAIDGKYHPGTEDQYVDGRIWFDFDVKLNDVSATGMEKLYIELWVNETWYTIATFDNADGSFDWTSSHIDISDRAFGNIFRVRFTADGALTSDILSWFVDNVNIYRQCDAATELTADGLDEFTIELNWTPPATGGGSGGDGEWIHWDDGINFDGIGLTGGGVFSVANHWDPDMITQYDGQYITKVRFFVYPNVVSSTYTINVWEGAGASNLVYSQPVTSFIVGDWNEYTLTTPVPVNVTDELWIGYTVDSPDGENPAGCDAGPGVVGYGDMITLDGVVWDPISSFGFDLNWNLQAFVGDMTDAPAPLPSIEDQIVYNNPNGAVVNGGEVSPVGLDENANRALTGYNIYWNNDGAGYEYLDFTEDSFYMHVVDPEWAVGSLQCYYVTAVYEDCEPASNEACWIVTGIEAPELSDDISVFPNPARELLNVTSSSDISHVTIMNYVGQVVYNQKVVEDNDIQVNVAGFETGVYMVKVETSAGIVVKKVTIAH